MAGEKVLPGRMSDDADLARVVARAREELRHLDPLGATLLGEPGLGLPPGDPEFETEARARLTTLLTELDGVSGGLGAEDEIDRLSLAAGLRRALPAPGPRPPFGSLQLERHLLARLPGLVDEAEAAAEGLAEVVEAAPRFLADSRRGTLGGSIAAGQVAVAAGKRAPQLLDLSAAAARAVPISPGLRQRLEAGLGQLLAAAAEDTGWLLKEYLPAAGPPPPRPDLEHELPGLGLGGGLEGIEAEAEGLLAEQALQRMDLDLPTRQQESASVAQQPDQIQAGTLLQRVGEGWSAAGRNLADWSGPSIINSPCWIDHSPPWLQPLLQPLALVPFGALSTRTIRLLVGPAVGRQRDADRSASLLETYACDYLPAAWQRHTTRLARLLLPSGEAIEGWRALARSTAPGLGEWQPDRFRRELSWRSILALVAVGLIRGRLQLTEAAGLVVAETGIDRETAELQCAHVAVQPLGALTFIAGRGRVEAAVARLAAAVGEPEARAKLLAAGPVPAAGLDRLGADAGNGASN